MKLPFDFMHLTKFQLHHTGIKTTSYISCIANSPEFQLHHTGIKTSLSPSFGLIGSPNFNCTIQELKPRYRFVETVACRDFNCTIQELKHARDGLEVCNHLYFNCTIQELKHKILFS